MFKHVKQMHMEKTVFVLFLSHEYDLRIHMILFWELVLVILPQKSLTMPDAYAHNS